MQTGIATRKSKVPTRHTHQTEHPPFSACDNFDGYFVIAAQRTVSCCTRYKQYFILILLLVGTLSDTDTDFGSSVILEFTFQSCLDSVQLSYKKSCLVHFS